jgi:hypothetical protein
MFHWIDLIAPIGVAVVAVVLCGIAIWKSAKPDAKVLVCVITAVMFMASVPGLYVIRCAALSSDYTVEGLRVRQGELNRCEREQVAADVVWVRDWWQADCPDKKAAVAAQLDDKLLVCVDSEKLGTASRWMRGYTWGGVAVVGWNGKLSYVRSLIRHELSHMAAVGCGYPLDEVAHHKLFSDLGLGY